MVLDLLCPFLFTRPARARPCGLPRARGRDAPPGGAPRRARRQGAHGGACHRPGTTASDASAPGTSPRPTPPRAPHGPRAAPQVVTRPCCWTGIRGLRVTPLPSAAPGGVSRGRMAGVQALRTARGRARRRPSAAPRWPSAPGLLTRVGRGRGETDAWSAFCKPRGCGAPRGPSALACRRRAPAGFSLLHLWCPTPAFTCCRKRERSGRWRQSGARRWSAEYYESGASCDTFSTLADAGKARSPERAVPQAPARTSLPSVGQLPADRSAVPHLSVSVGEPPQDGQSG